MDIFCFIFSFPFIFLPFPLCSSAFVSFPHSLLFSPLYHRSLFPLCARIFCFCSLSFPFSPVVFRVFPDFLFVYVMINCSCYDCFISVYFTFVPVSLFTQSLLLFSNTLSNQPIPFRPLLPGRPLREELLIRNTFPSRPHAHDCAAATGKLRSEDKRSERAGGAGTAQMSLYVMIWGVEFV